MQTLEDVRLVTSDEFVTGLLSELKLKHVDQLHLADTLEDKRFARAFEKLVEHQASLGVAVDFSLATNPYHGDFSTLREALYSLRERHIVSINNPRFKTVEIKLDEDDANYYLDRSSIPRAFMAEIVAEIFETDAAPNEAGRDSSRN